MREELKKLVKGLEETMNAFAKMYSDDYDWFKECVEDSYNSFIRVVKGLCDLFFISIEEEEMLLSKAEGLRNWYIEHGLDY